MPSEPGTTADSTSIVTGVVAAVVAVALIVLVVLLKRRKTSLLVRANEADNLEQSQDEPQRVHPPASVGISVGNGGGISPPNMQNSSPQRHPPAEASLNYARDIDSSSAPAGFTGLSQWDTEHTTDSFEDNGVGHHGADTAVNSEEKTSLRGTTAVATASRAHSSTDESAELERLHPIPSMAGAASAAGRPQSGGASGGGASSLAERQRPPSHFGVGNAVLAAINELANQCEIPGFSEAAEVVRILANLVKDCRDNDSASGVRLRQCRSMLLLLRRAAEVVDKVISNGVQGVASACCAAGASK